MDKELLSSNHLYIDGSAITNSTGQNKYARLTKDLVKGRSLMPLSRNCSPTSWLEKIKMPAKDEGTGGVVEGKS